MLPRPSFGSHLSSWAGNVPCGAGRFWSSQSSKQQGCGRRWDPWSSPIHLGSWSPVPETVRLHHPLLDLPMLHLSLQIQHQASEIAPPCNFPHCWVRDRQLHLVNKDPTLGSSCRHTCASRGSQGKHPPRPEPWASQIAACPPAALKGAAPSVLSALHGPPTPTPHHTERSLGLQCRRSWGK